MIIGHKPSGYITRGTLYGKKEFETRQCVHCQRTWVYQPGSKNQRGFCLKCYGVLCGNPVCLKECMPYEKRFSL